jgi:hypothetical protein
VFAIASYFVLPGQYTGLLERKVLIMSDYPSTTKWLSEAERELAVKRLQIGHEVEERSSQREAFIAAIKDPRTWVSSCILKRHMGLICRRVS